MEADVPSCSIETNSFHAEAVVLVSNGTSERIARCVLHRCKLPFVALSLGLYVLCGTIVSNPTFECIAEGGRSIRSLLRSMRKKTTEPNRVRADPNQWSEKSKRSVSFELGFIKEYTDIDYKCWRCGRRSVFTAEEQKYTYEVKKAYIHQKRILCSNCWKESNEITNQLDACEKRWKESKTELKHEQEFLSEWLELVIKHEKYVPCEHDAAKKNMLQKLLKQNR